MRGEVQPGRAVSGCTEEPVTGRGREIDAPKRVPVEAGIGGGSQCQDQVADTDAGLHSSAGSDPDESACPELGNEFTRVNADGRDAHSGALHREPVALVKSGKTQHPADLVVAGDAFQVALCDEPGSQRVAGQEDGFSNVALLGVDVDAHDAGSLPETRRCVTNGFRICLLAGARRKRPGCSQWIRGCVWLGKTDPAGPVMGLKATVYKATLELSDMDRHVYETFPVVLARHPSETDERMMIRLLAYALHVADPGDRTPLELTQDLWDPDLPALIQNDLTGRIAHWIEVGQPDERKILRAAARADQVTIYSFGPESWWPALAGKLARVRNVQAWRISDEQVESLATLAERTMVLQVTVQDGALYVGNGRLSIEITPARLHG